VQRRARGHARQTHVGANKELEAQRAPHCPGRRTKCTGTWGRNIQPGRSVVILAQPAQVCQVCTLQQGTRGMTKNQIWGKEVLAGFSYCRYPPAQTPS
jgi:hypothetical protein